MFRRNTSLPLSEIKRCKIDMKQAAKFRPACALPHVGSFLAHFPALKMETMLVWNVSLLLLEETAFSPRRHYFGTRQVTGVLRLPLGCHCVTVVWLFPSPRWRNWTGAVTDGNATDSIRRAYPLRRLWAVDQTETHRAYHLGTSSLRRRQIR
jgi:hypothetical protein